MSLSISFSLKIFKNVLIHLGLGGNKQGRPSENYISYGDGTLIVWLKWLKYSLQRAEWRFSAF